MWAIAPLTLALFLIGAFVLFRVHEEKRGARYFDAYRTHADELAAHIYRLLVMGQIPREWRTTLMSVTTRGLHRLVVLTVELLRAIERPLTRLSHRMRTAVPAKSKENVSEFLKTLTPRKSKGNGEASENSV